MPADPAQFLFLAGIVCLTIAPRLRWWPPIEAPELVTQTSPGTQARVEWRLFLGLALWPIIFSGMAGYYVCFWPGVRFVRRVLLSVLFPAVLGLSLISGRSLYIRGQPVSVLESTSTLFGNAKSIPALLWNLGTGVHFCLAGILLVAVFAWRLVSNSGLLPVGLPACSVVLEDTKSWPRARFLSWFLIGPCAFVVSLTSVVTVLVFDAVFSRSPVRSEIVLAYRSGLLLTALVMVGVAIGVTGRDGLKSMRQSLRWPREDHLLLGLFLPAGISVLISVGNYAANRIQWAAHDFGRFAPPEFWSYFNSPEPWLLLLFFAATAEEIIFRGVLQRRFIERYGLYRGIFLVSLVWAAFHFFTDSYSGASDFGVFLKLTLRISTCLSLGYVLGWLTLRSGSILPAALAHTLYNVLIFSNFGPPFPGKDWVRIILWGALAYLLFRFWPVQVKVEPMALTTSAPSPDLAT